MREIVIKAETQLSEADKGQINVPQAPVLATPAVVAFVGGYAAAKVFGK